MILLIDNYDSFTYNLYQLLCSIEPAVTVIRNDQLTIKDIQHLAPTAIIFSPGPGRPRDAGKMEEIIKHYYKEIPMLGICLGHQAIGEVFHSQITHAQEMKHGEVDTIYIQDRTTLFHGLPKEIPAARYHSLIVETLGSELKVLATSAKGEIMALQHIQYPIYGVQFHPESIMTPQGKQIVYNFLKGEQTTC